MSLAQDITRAKGGEWHGSYGLIPGPGHSASDRSLSIRDKGVDDVTLNSFAGDDWRAVKDAWRADGTLPPLEPRNVASGSTLATYTYRDVGGEPVFRVLRKPNKKFPCQRPDGRGGWAWGKGEATPPLYRLPELLAAHINEAVYVVEGEKDADNLAALGLVATTGAGGAGNWRDALADTLSGRECIIIPDNDAPGHDHAAKVAASLAKRGIDHVIVKLPGLPDKGDVSDWLAAGGDAVQLASHAAAAWAEPAPALKLAGRAAALEAESKKAWGTTTAAELAARSFNKVRYLVPGILPEGFALLAGKPKCGKSYWALGVAIAVASGGVALGSVQCEARDVLYLALEDSERRLHDRLHQMLPFGGQVPDRLHVECDAPRLGDGLEQLVTAWLDDHPLAGLIVFDVWRAIKPIGVGRQKSAYDEDAAAAAPLLAIVKTRPGVTLLVLHHTRKMDADDPFDMISGTNGLTGVPDSLYVIAKSGEDTRLSGKGREFEEFERILKRDKLTGGWTLGGDAREVAKTSERQEVLDVLSEAGDEALTLAAIASEVGKAKANTSKLLKKLVRDGLAESPAYGRYRLKRLNRENYGGGDA